MKRSGKINFGCIIMSILLAIGGLAAYQIIPLRVRAAEVNETVKRAAETAATDQRYKDENIRAAILETARNNKLPITEKQIRIERGGQVIHVDVHYQVTIDILGYKYDMKFDPYYDAPRFD